MSKSTEEVAAEAWQNAKAGKTSGFLTDREAQAALRLAAQEVTAPQACADQQPRQTLAEMESEWEACKSLKRASGHDMPAVACLTEQSAKTASPEVRAAAKALLAAAEAKATAKLAADRAKQAVAAINKTPHLDAFNSLTGAERTEFYQEHETAIRAEMLGVSMQASHPGRVTVNTNTGAVSQSQKV